MTDKYNPIISKEEIGSSWRIFQKRPIPEPGTAIVLSGGGQSLLTIKQGISNPTGGELRKYNLLYRINLTDYPLNFKCSLPGKENIFDFQADVKFTCSVKDPETIVSKNITDIGGLLERLIENVMRGESRKYSVDKIGEAEINIRDIVKRIIMDDENFNSFNISQLIIKLSLKEEDLARVRQANIFKEESRIEDERQALELKRGKLDIEKEMLVEEHNIKVKEKRQQSEIKLTKEKIEMYTEILGGRSEELALKLTQAGNNESIVDILDNHKQRDREYFTKTINTIIDADIMEEPQILELILKELAPGVIQESTPLIATNESANIPRIQGNIKEENTGNKTSEDEDFSRPE